MHDFVPCKIPPDIIRFDELGQVLVCTENGDRIAFFSQSCCQCADNVVSFIAVTGEVGDASGAAESPALASGTTIDGSVSFGELVPVDGTALISCTGGTYIDEATGEELDAPDTRAVVNVVGDAVFTVSPLTEIATQLERLPKSARSLSNSLS